MLYPLIITDLHFNKQKIYNFSRCNFFIFRECIQYELYHILTDDGFK